MLFDSNHVIKLCWIIKLIYYADMRSDHLAVPTCNVCALLKY